MSSLTIRPAGEADIPALLDIYNDAVRNTTAIWNETEVDADNRRAWLVQRQAANCPVLVAEHTTLGVVGYASYGPWRNFEGYRYTVENSVYVHPEARRMGVARTLLEALITHAIREGKHVMVAAIELGNAASIALHQQLGFVKTGQMPQVGCKFGRWLDLAFLQLAIDQRPTP